MYDLEYLYTVELPNKLAYPVSNIDLEVSRQAKLPLIKYLMLPTKDKRKLEARYLK